MSSYPITEQDVRDYLASLGPDDEAGLVENPFECPIARAGKHKYGVRFVITRGHYYPLGYPGQITITPPELERVIWAVDRLDTQDTAVTRRQVEEAING